MTIPSDLKYSKEHEWARIEGDRATVGITDYAQEQLGDVVYVELPQPGTAVQFMEPFGVVESVKTASDLYAPVSGRVVEVNERLTDEPELVNQSPYGDGWMVVVQMNDPADLDRLMDAEAYEAYLATLEEGH
ncbi:MAG: glycine cleavage system protein GcvH [Anaerolineae bacterium]|nr:glycine cleavage system protein GcvH [Anaerolineae bacterium]